MLKAEEISAYDDPSKAFVGVRFILLGFESDKEDEVRLKLLEGGGVDAVDYGPNCSHVIVDKLVYDDPVCVAARRDGKTLVTSLWVDHSFDVGIPVDHSSVMYRPLKDLNGIPGAKSLVVCLTGYQRQDREDIMTMVALMGASFSKPLVANKVTHLICYKFEGEKYELANKMKRIRLVNHHWLEDCLKAWELLPESDYNKSGYEMEMEAEAKDSEEETEDIALAINAGRKNVISSQNPRVENNKSFHQSPIMQEFSRNSSYLSASKNLPNVGETSKKFQSSPAKEVNFEKASFSSGETREKNLHMASARSPAKSPAKLSSEVPSDMHHSMMISEKVDNALSSASLSFKKTPDSNVSKLSSKSSIRSTPNKPSLPLRSERNESNLKGSPSSSKVNKLGITGVFDFPPLERHQDATGFEGVKTPLKGNLSNLDEGQSFTLSYKRKMTVSRGSTKSVNHDPKPSIEDELPAKATTDSTNVQAYGSSADRSRVLAGDISPLNLTPSLREKTSVSPKEGVNVSLATEDIQECDDQAIQRTPKRLENQTSLNVDKKDLSPSRTNNCTSGAEMQQNEPQSVENPSPWTNSVEGKSGQLKPLKRKMLAKKTLGSKPSIGKSSTAKKKGSISLQKAVLQNENVIHPSEAVAMEGIDNATATEKVVVDGEDETKAADDEGQNEFELESNKEKAVDIETPLSREGITRQGDDNIVQTKKKKVAKSGSGKRNSTTKAEEAVCKEKIELTRQGDDNIVQTKKKKVAKSGSGKKNSTTKAGEAVCKEKIELTESKSTGDAAEKKLTTGKKRPLVKSKSNNEKDPAEEAACSEKIELTESKSMGDAAAKKITKDKKNPLVKSKSNDEKDPAEKAVCSEKIELTESKSTGAAAEKKITKGKKRPLVKSKVNNEKDPVEDVTNDGSNSKQDEKKTVSGNEEETVVLARRTKGRPSKKLKSSADMEKENIPSLIKQQITSKEDSESHKKPLKNITKADKTGRDYPVKAIQKSEVKTEPARFILSGHRLQRKEFQQVIKRLKGRICRDSHNWSYQATHSIVPDPLRRTEKFFAAAASGSWILKTDYLTASNEAGKFLPEEPYEWHKKCLTDHGLISLEAPRKWRLLKEKTGHGAFYGTRFVIYGDCLSPRLDTLKRVIKAGDGIILATSPPYTRFLQSKIDFAIVSPGMPRVDMWVQEFLRHEVPCVAPDYLVEYVCRPGYPLDKHVHHNTNAWAEKSMKELVSRLEEVVIEDVGTPEECSGDDVACQVCGSRDRGEEMLICGDEHGSVGCGVGVHFDCLDPPLVGVPDEDWFCSSCSRQRKKSKTIGSSSSKRASKSKK